MATTEQLIRRNSVAEAATILVGFMMLGFLVTLGWANDCFDLDPPMKIERVIYASELR